MIRTAAIVLGLVAWVALATTAGSAPDADRYDEPTHAWTMTSGSSWGSKVNVADVACE